MRLESKLAEELLEQFVEWHKLPSGGGRLTYPSAVGFMRYIRSGDEGAPPPVRLEPWWTDDYASITNKLLMQLKADRPEEYQAVIYYFFNNQRLDLTADHFRRHHSVVSQLINSGVAYLDGMLRGYAA